MGDKPTRVEVRIYGDTYVVRAQGIPAERIRRLAASVDERMRELTNLRPALSVTRAAVLTALNLADELWRLREQHSRLMAALGQRLSDLEARLEAAAAADPGGPSLEGEGPP